MIYINLQWIQTIVSIAKGCEVIESIDRGNIGQILIGFAPNTIFIKIGYERTY